MAKPEIFVPYGIKEEYSLYTVRCDEAPYTEIWFFYDANRPGANHPDKITRVEVDAKLKRIRNLFGEQGGREFELLLRGEGRLDAKIHDNTPSVFLGLYLTVKQQIENLPFNEGWASITVTGDLEIRDRNILLKSVGDIEKKYEGFKREIKNHIYSNNDRHLFLYVSEKRMPEDKEQDSHIRIEYFSPQNTMEQVLNCVFGLEFFFSDERQKHLYEYMLNRQKKAKNITYIETADFRQMEMEMFSPHWSGFFIRGEGDSGKSALAEALAKHLLERRKIYVPLWIFVENDQIKIPQDENISRVRSIKDYLIRKVNELLGNTGEITQSLSENKYLLIIDNLEFDNITEVLTAIEDIIVPVVKNKPENKPYLIITSRVGSQKDELKLKEMGIDPKDASELNKKDIEDFVAEINKSREDLTDLKAEPGYTEFIQALYDNFRYYPGLILVAVNGKKTMLELLPNLKNMHGDDIEKKALIIYRTVFSMLDEFTQSVLFTFIDIISPDTMVDKAGLVKKVKEKKLAKSNLGLNDDVENALNNLEDKFIIYREKVKGTSRFGMKGLAFLTFMFGDIFTEKPDAAGENGKNLREIVVENTKILQMALRYNRSREIINRFTAAITKPHITGEIYHQEAMITTAHATEYIEESLKYYEEARKSAEPGSELYIEIARGYLQALNSASMIKEAWDELDRFLEGPDRNLEDRELQEQIGDAYYRKGYYIERIGEHFEKADTAYQKALALCAATDLYLARNISIKLALNLSTWSDAAENKKELLDRAGKTLDVAIFAGCTEDNFPILYADKEMVLGDIYDRIFLLRKQRKDADNAIDSYTHARNIYSKEKKQIKYGEACRHVSLACFAASRSKEFTDNERNQMREQAIQTCNEAIAIFKNDFPVYYAAAQNHLGNIYKSFVEKQHNAEFFTMAITAFKDAETIFGEKKYDFWYGRIQHNLGDLHRQYAANSSLQKNEKESHLQDAIKIFDGSIKYRKKYPSYYAATLLQLGRACITLAEILATENTEKKDLLNKAVQTLGEGIGICRDDEKLNKGRLYGNKGVALEELFLLTGKGDYIKDGIEHEKEAMKYTTVGSEERARMEKDLQRMEKYDV